MIELSKKYRTRDGREVRLYETDGSLPFPVHGAIMGLRHPGWVMAEWTEDGRPVTSGHDLPNDLIEVKPSAIEEMIAWLEDEILRDRQSEASNMRYNSFARKTYGTALEEARRIRDSNATSDE